MLRVGTYKSSFTSSKIVVYKIIRNALRDDVVFSIDNLGERRCIPVKKLEKTIELLSFELVSNEWD